MKKRSFYCLVRKSIEYIIREICFFMEFHRKVLGLFNIITIFEISGM